MKSQIVATLTALILPVLSQATPTHVTAWFLKEPKVVYLPQVNPKWSTRTAEQFECVPMGDGCFHPQLGYFDRNAMDAKKSTANEDGENAASKTQRVELKTFNSHETDRIECDKTNMFDIYCGREGKGSGGRDGEIEVWLDVSSSMRLIDPDQKNKPCGRKVLLDAIQSSCGEKVVFKTYNTSIKEISDTSYACINHGLNDSERVIKWIESSKAKHLFLISDITEFNTSLADYLQSIGAKVKGGDTKDFFAKDLGDFVKDIAPLCK